MSDPAPALLIGSLRWAVGAALTAAAAARFARAALPTLAASPAERYLRWFVAAAFLVAVTVALPGFAGRLGPAALLLGGALLFALSRLLPPVPPPRRGLRLRWLVLAPPLGLALLPLLADLPAHLAAPPSNWDAMTYHLYFPARWLQEGRIHHIPTVFSDNAAAFAPQNGALFHAWSMGLLGGDAVCNVLQLPALAAIACAVYRLGRGLGAAPAAAAFAGATVCWLPPLRSVVASANVDGWMLAFWLAGLVWLVHYARRPSAGLLVAAGLAAGLAAGTKTFGLSLLLVHAIVAALLGLAARRPAHLAGFAAAAAAGGGVWFVRNAALYGNPLFPLSLGVGGWRLPGAYGVDALRAGEFHVAGVGALAARVYDSWGVAVCLLLGVGLVALGWRMLATVFRSRDRRARVIATIVAAQGLATLLWYAWGVPHNAETRFLLPTLLLALAGWAVALERARRRGRWLLMLLAALAVTALALAGRPDRAWLVRLDLLAGAGVDLLPLPAVSLAVYATGAATALVRRRPLRLVLAALTAVAGVSGLMLGVRAADAARPAFLARANYGAWADGFVPLHDPELPPLRVAYTGANVPYALMGPGFRHRVVYCNTRGESDDGFHDFWLRDPRRFEYHKPGIYRGPDDAYERWLEHLRRRRIDLVVIFALHPVERRYLPATATGFPLEQIWARSHPERFLPVTRRPSAEIYRVRWDEEPASDPLPEAEPRRPSS